MNKFKTMTVSIPVKITETQIVDIEFTSLEKCFFCKHWNHSDNCKAFPDGIPNVILSGNNDHSNPLSTQDNEIVFEPAK